MRLALASLLLASACAGPGQAALGRTPTATTKATPTAAPAASTSDAEREQMIESNDSMRDAGNAHREASQESKGPPAPLPPTTPGSVQPTATPAQPN